MVGDLTSFVRRTYCMNSNIPFTHCSQKITEAYKGHCVLSKDVLSFVFQTFDFQVLCFGFYVLCPVLMVELVAQPRC